MRTIQEVLAELQQLAAKAQAGEDVSQRRAQVEAELASLGYTPSGQHAPQQQQVQQQAAPQQQVAQQQLAAPGAQPVAPQPVAPLPQQPAVLAGVGAPAAPQFAANGQALSTDERSELERLRAAEGQARMAQVADQFAGLVQASAQQHQQAQAQQMAEQMQAALAQRGLVPADGSDPVLQHAVMTVLSQMHGGSRFAGPGSDAAAVAHLGAGNSFAPNGQPQQGGGFTLGAGVQVSQPGNLQVGADRAFTDLKESRSLGRLMSIVARAHKAHWTLEEHEQRFLREVHQKAMSIGTPSAGGLLVPEEWMPDILGLVRSNAVIRRANPRIVPFNRTMNQTSVSTGSTAYYTQENARIPVSELTFAEAPVLSPKYLTALVPVSNYLLQAESSVDTLVRDDMVSALTTREDLAFLQGTGGGGEPTGFRNLPGVILNPIAPGTDGFVPTLSDFRRIKGRTRIVGTQAPRWTWFFHPALLTYLETLTDTTGRFLVDSNILQINADGVSGTFDGLPFYASYQIPTALTIGASTNATYVLLVDMSQAILGESVDLQIDVSTEATYSPDGGTTHISAFQQNQTVFRVIMGHDINHRVPSRGVIDQEGILV